MLALGYNKAKDLFANMKGKEHTLFRSFASMKMLNSYNAEEITAICRERTGGGGFLRSSQIPDGMEVAHIGITLGDNRVLLQKVVKDILSDMPKKKHELPKMTMCPKKEIPKKSSIADLDTLINLVHYREIASIKSVGQLIQKKTKQEKKKFYDVWMFEVSDEVQDCAVAFGDRYVLQGALQYLAETTDAKVKEILTATIRLHLLLLIRRSLSWYLIEGTVSHEAASNLDSEFD